LVSAFGLASIKTLLRVSVRYAAASRHESVHGFIGVMVCEASATGWLQVACIATTLRHQSRERGRRRPAALAP
jgi:hypothetical protein